MRKTAVIALALCLVFATVLASGCQALGILVGSGKTVTQDFTLADFTRIAAGWTFDVTVSQGAAFSVSVTVDDNLQTYLDVAKNGDTLDISMKSGYSYTSTHLKAVVTMPSLKGLTLSGASKGSVSGFSSTDDFTLGVSGASQASFTSTAVGKLTFDISGASRASGAINASGDAVLKVTGASSIDLSGQAGNLNLQVSGASTADLTGFAVHDASFNISGASNATVTASGTLSGDISGASRLYYTGTPTLGSINTSGASSVNKK